MAIAFDAASTGNATATSLTIAHTCSGLNRLLFVGVQGEAGDLITGVTYAGTSMTLVDKQEITGEGRYVYLYVLHNPATGANNVVVSASSSSGIRASISSYTGCKQTSIVDSKNKATAVSPGSWSLSTTTVASNCWTVAVVRAQEGALAAGASTTMRTTTTGYFNIFDSNSAKASPGTFTLNFTATSGVTNSWGGVIASFAPISSSSGFFNFF